MFTSLFRAFPTSFHLVTECLDLLAENAIQQIGVKLRSAFDGRLAVGFFWRLAELFIGPSLDGYNDEERGDEGFLQIGKAEVFSDVGDGFAELWREVEGFVAR